MNIIIILISVFLEKKYAITLKEKY